MALSLLDEVLLAAKSPTKPCDVCALDEEHRVALERAYSEHGIGAFRLHRVCRMWGLDHLTEWKIARHVEGRCSKRPSTRS